MKVNAINGSPKMGKGTTALLLNPFLEGMREAGAEVELFTYDLRCRWECVCHFSGFSARLRKLLSKRQANTPMR